MSSKEISNAREARNAYYRQYRANNREKIKEINRRYWEKKANAAQRAKEVANAD